MSWYNVYVISCELYLFFFYLIIYLFGKYELSPCYVLDSESTSLC